MKLLCQFSVLGVDCVPWSVPDIGTGTNKAGKPFRFARRGKKTQVHLGKLSFEDWQAMVKDEARRSLLGLEACSGPVHLELTFVAATPPGKRNGELWFVPLRQDTDGVWHKAGRNEPDLVNLFKGTEDAISGTVFHNDVQTRKITAETLYGPLPGVHVKVWMIEPADYPGQGDVVPAVPTRKRPRPTKKK